jgi:hypothetical protein
MNTIRDHRGARNPNAVLTPRLVAEARRLHASGFGYGFVAAWLGVTKSCVQALVTGRTWKTSGRRPGRARSRP